MAFPGSFKNIKSIYDSLLFDEDQPFNDNQSFDESQSFNDTQLFNDNQSFRNNQPLNDNQSFNDNQPFDFNDYNNNRERAVTNSMAIRLRMHLNRPAGGMMPTSSITANGGGSSTVSMMGPTYHQPSMAGVLGSSSDNTPHRHSFAVHHNPLIMSGPGFVCTPSPSDANLDSTANSPLTNPPGTYAASSRRPSYGRVLVPQTSTKATPQSAVSTVSSPQNANGPSSGGGGPTGRVYTIPPRPKPGRKPATDEPASKRKAQNRESQRAFRARKVAKFQEVVESHEEAIERHRNEMNEQLCEKSALQTEVRKLRETLQSVASERDYWRDEYHMSRDANPTAAFSQPKQPTLFAGQHMLCRMNPLNDARRDTPSRTSIGSSHAYGTPNTEVLGCGDCKPDDCACMKEIANDMTFQDQLLDDMESVPLPPRNGRTPVIAQSDDDKDFAHREIDFTAKFQGLGAMSNDNDCGWCADRPELCLCKDPSLRPDGADGMAILSRVGSSSSMEDVKLAPTMTGPGSCADCQSNPEQRAWCQRVAQLRSEATPPSSRRSSKRAISLDVMEPKVESRIDVNKPCASPFVGERSIGCSDAFKLLDGRVPMDVDHMDWRNLKPVTRTSLPPIDARRDTFTMEPGMYSAMELDASSILTTLQHSSRPIEPRPSDGDHASLVRIAEERRQATNSPRTGAEVQDGLPAVSAFNMGF